MPPNGLPISRCERVANHIQRYRVVCQGDLEPRLCTTPSPVCGAGSLILPRRSRPRQAHAARRSSERKLIWRAVLTRRGGFGYPAPHHQLNLRSPPDANIWHNSGRNPALWLRPPKRSARACVPQHRPPLSSVSPSRSDADRML
jgi:hypothetical protein